MPATSQNFRRLQHGRHRGVAVTLCALALVFPLRAATADSIVSPPPAPAAAETAGIYQAPESPAALLKLDGPARGFFAARLERSYNDYHRVRLIVDAILQPDGLDFVYDAGATFDARETFHRRRGNCASFSFLVVAVAREFGLQASFQTIRRPGRWQRLGGIVVAVQHLAVKVETMHGACTIDLEPAVAPVSATPGLMRSVSDQTAFALFYCNIGFSQLVLGDTERALRYTTLATEIDPRCASAWANRATLLVRKGDLLAARESFRLATRLRPQGDAALDGFVSVLRQLGTPQDLREADKLERRARAVRERNPYYHQELARLARAQNDLASAEKHLRRAISLQHDQPEFYVEWISVLEQLGRTDDARRAAARLQKLSPSPPPRRSLSH